RQPELVIKSGKTLSFSPSSSNQPIYLIWVVALLFFYSSFLFFFITYRNVKLQGYSKRKSSSYLQNAQIEFITNDNLLHSEQQKGDRLAAAASRYTEYLKLQEIRLLCKTNPILDINTVVTYFSIVVSVLSAIQGIQKIIEWSPP
ncbi:MAG: hypothetical protein II617_00440, partial [Firmicutes bacterium]|nr:hypothetical protein [Bacillota bacterium]